MNNVKSSNTLYCICILYGNLSNSHEEVKYPESEVRVFLTLKTKAIHFIDYK